MAATGAPAYHRKVNLTTSAAFLTGNAGQAVHRAGDVRRSSFHDVR